MADWIDSLLPASFAGISFSVEDGSGGQCGRRYQLTNFPFSDRFSVDDLGRLNAASTVRGFIVDNDGDLHNHHNQLVDALNNGENILIHPRLGRMLVLPGECSYTFQGSRIKYTLQFLPPKEQAQAAEQEETSQLVEAASDTALKTVNEKAADQIETTNRSLLEDAQKQVGSVLGTLRDVNGKIDAAIAPVAELAQTIDEIADQAVKLIRQPATLFNTLRDVYYSVLSAVDDIDAAINSYRDLRFTPSIDSNATTPTQIARNANRQAMADATNAAVLIGAVRLVAQKSAKLNVTSNDDSPFDSYQHAIAVRDELMSGLDELIETLENPAYDTMLELRARFYRHIDAHGIRLPRIKSARFGVALPAWVIAHDVYGDATLLDDVIRRNNIGQPVYIEAGTTLEVLTND